MLLRPDIRVLCGRGGQGKSTLARHWLANERRVIVFDPKIEPDAARGRHIAQTQSELVELARAKSFAICWRGFGLDPLEGFEFGNRVAMAAGNCWVHWEEVDLFSPRGALPPYGRALVNSGRHDGVRLIACARRPLRVSRDLTASATRIVCFQTTEPRDVRYLEEFIGEAAKQVRTLAQWHALDWREREGARVVAAPFT
jgi:hypothetical protein